MARKKIGDLLVEKGLITKEQLADCLKEQSGGGNRLGAILVEKGLITEEQLVDTVSERLGIPRVSIDSMVLDPEVVQRVSVDIARRYTLIPIFAIGNNLTLAMADPLNIIAIEHVKYLTGADIKRAVAPSREIIEAIDQYYSVADSLNEIVASRGEEAEAAGAPLAVQRQAEAESPIVKLVNVIITKAVKDKASDIHIEPDETSLRIRYRINGVMREEAAPSKSMQSEIISRIKIAADMDVSEKRLPQDGRFMVLVDDVPIDLR
ncbi:MAG: ATPase, T2SS/T4P/T4SS family, partial [Candidatus Zixiibacteriota bacterium]